MTHPTSPAAESRSPAPLLREFHERFDLHRQDRPGHPSPQVAELRQRLIEEEVAELAEAVRLAADGAGLDRVAHELADVVYVAYGTALSYGIDLDAVLAEVHRSNLSKLGQDGRPVRRPDGKVLRGEQYEPPRVAAVLADRSATGERAAGTAEPASPASADYVVVRQAEAADTAGLAELRRAWAAEQGAHETEPGFANRFAGWWHAETSHRVTWVAQSDAALVGMVNLAIFDRMPTPGRQAVRWGYLANAFVLPEHRNRGIGHRLLDAVLAYADGEGLVRVVLNPSPRSVPLYLRAGFSSAHQLMVRRPPAEPTRPAGGQR
ncbi:GNAT family N-acetyltransferase [Natronosporangium hydrolyticum]|uniref:GNAT family N-acetyltransferase n=1 Tax=Natronosporangium hydrolyticum TaxID=2811111 RepID=A0A895Y4K8_9ACTN|nr:GNAT family N-acetyltransferase [Natronosporangium hydrolyticum]QSB12634.1 GNAT family N-acetyltransferase [Natronosporangium hydrolyticum]